MIDKVKAARAMLAAGADRRHTLGVLDDALALAAQPSAGAQREASCDDQFAQASAIAANIGYVLVPEPDHPDCPHKANGMAKILRDQGADRSRYLNPSNAPATPAQPDTGDVAALREARAHALAMTKKHGNPNGTDYEQGQNDMGHRWVSQLDTMIAALSKPNAQGREG